MPKTVIRSKIQRDGGTRVSIAGLLYHFRPQPKLGAPVAHVCEVSEKAHVNRFLAITEGYELFLGEDEDAAPEDLAPAVPDDDPVQEPEEPEVKEPVAEKSAPAEPEGEEDAGEVDPDAPLDTLSDDDLQALYKSLNHGRAAHRNTKRETLIEKIEEMRAVLGV